MNCLCHTHQIKMVIESDTHGISSHYDGPCKIAIGLKLFTWQGSKWVFKVKYKSDGKVEHFKARLVAKGYAQKCGIDYFETFSPVVRFTSIRALLAYAVQNDMLAHQMDVVTAFLNGTLDEEIYMSQPEGYIKPGDEHLVCRRIETISTLLESSEY